MMPLTQAAGGLIYLSSTTTGSTTVSNFNISSVATGQLLISTGQYTTSNVLFTPSAMNGGWYQAQADNFNLQMATAQGHMQNQAAYYQQPPHPRPEPPAHVAAARVVGARARKLLMSVLSPAQRQTYEDKRYFDVHVAGNTYRIHQGTHGNVRELGADGREKYLWCAQPDHVPAEDAMLAQMLLLKNDEAAFRRVANRRPI